MKQKLTIGLALAASILFASAASANVTYTYDNLGRLASAAYDNGVTVRYAYDLNGNRLVQAITTTSATGVWGSFNWGAAPW